MFFYPLKEPPFSDEHIKRIKVEFLHDYTVAYPTRTQLLYKIKYLILEVPQANTAKCR